MRFLRKDLVDRLTENGDLATAHQVEARLPEEVDSERDEALLHQCGVDAEYLFDEKS